MVVTKFTIDNRLSNEETIVDDMQYIVNFVSNLQVIYGPVNDLDFSKTVKIGPFTIKRA